MQNNFVESVLNRFTEMKNEQNLKTHMSFLLLKFTRDKLQKLLCVLMLLNLQVVRRERIEKLTGTT